jgi:hypothetical protein
VPTKVVTSPKPPTKRNVGNRRPWSRSNAWASLSSGRRRSRRAFKALRGYQSFRAIPISTGSHLGDGMEGRFWRLPHASSSQA